ncbi:Kinesin-like_protein [Hexamita inflata]|uniref:Kinesin-like protein n=1 Tax=Hexamita inflata TaxID=28002 RepID=A0AA86QQA8_9EUKA|nr:Kinesin-like protein [Hexamita inflata]
MFDLAGSEKLSLCGVSGQRLKETIAINQSILNLNLVVKKLVDKVSHVPYRDSTLTRMLQDSLNGNSKTMMVANINPASDNYEDTLSTLSFASQVNKIKNQPRINLNHKNAQIQEIRKRIQDLEIQAQK